MASLTRRVLPMLLGLTVAMLGPLVLAGSAEAAYTCFGQAATIVGSNRSQTIKGTARADVIVALGGDDKIYGGGGADLICAGEGADFVDGGAGNDRIDGGPGRFSGGRVRNDKLVGGPGDDFFSPVFDARGPSVDAGDRISYEASAAAVNVNATTQKVTGDGTDTWIGRRAEIIGSPHDDTFIGSPYRDVFNGGPGADAITGGAGDDTLRDDTGAAADADVLDGGLGNDQLFTWGGFDRLAGGEGNDTLYDYGAYAGVMDAGPGDDVIQDSITANSAQVIDAGAGNDQVSVFRNFRAGNPPRLQVDLNLGRASLQITPAVTFRFAGAERLRAYGFGLTYYGTPGNDQAWSDGTGRADLDGREGDDVLFGTTGSDRLAGGNGTDTGYPGGGSDTCLGIDKFPSGACESTS